MLGDQRPLHSCFTKEHVGLYNKNLSNEVKYMLFKKE